MKIFKLGREKTKNIVKKIPNKKDNLKKKYLSKNNKIPDDKNIKKITKITKEKLLSKSMQTVKSKIK